MSKSEGKFFDLKQEFPGFPPQDLSESNHLCSQTHFLRITWDLWTWNSASHLHSFPLISRLGFSMSSRLDLCVWYKGLVQIHQPPRGERWRPSDKNMEKSLWSIASGEDQEAEEKQEEEASRGQSH